MIEEGVAESVAVRIDGWLATQTGRMENRKGLQRSQAGLAFGDGRCGTRHWIPVQFRARTRNKIVPTCREKKSKKE